jgi:hypothetical protein
VWKSHQQPPEAITPRPHRIKRHDQWEKLVALFHYRPTGELVTYEKLLAIFSNVRSPWYALWMAVSRYNRQLEGQQLSWSKVKAAYRLMRKNEDLLPGTLGMGHT